MRVSELVFASGSRPGETPLSFAPKNITIFIGPNNGGKSRTLFELQQKFTPSGHQPSIVTSRISRSLMSDSEFAEKLARLQKPKMPGEDPGTDSIALEGRGGRQIVQMSFLRSGLQFDAHPNTYEYAANNFLRYFFLNIGGSGRLDLIRPAQAQPMNQNPTTTIGAIFKSDIQRSELSQVIKKAFGEFLVINATQMPNLTYMLSTEEPTDGIEKRLTDDAIEYFDNCRPVVDASDGTKAFIGILAEVIAGDPDVLLVDEPEAFLHPSLAYLLGQQIAIKARLGKQTFIATHSPAFLMGCILSGAEVDVVRLTYGAGVGTARHLTSDRLKQLMVDPLFRSVGAATALFYNSSVIVEGDSDRAFYDEINDRLHRYSDRGISHNIFLNAHNKQTVVNIVRPLRDVGIPTPFIFDIDWVKEDGQVWDRYFTASGAPVGLKEALAVQRRTVRNALEATGKDYKREGGISLLSPDDKLVADHFFDQMEQFGLFTVRNGELESWLASLPAERTKNKWLASVFDLMGADPDAAGYVMPGTDDVWAFMDRIAAWVGDPNRQGMN